VGAEKAAGEEEERKKLEDKSKAYTKFWTGFGKSLKMGLIEDQGNRWVGGVGGSCSKLMSPKSIWHGCVCISSWG
jgi:hypothetical protein